MRPKAATAPEDKMPTAMAEIPAVALSFANNFWGKDDAGVVPLLDRMHAAKQTCDELRSFYSGRASIEDEYARKLLSLCRKPLGSQEMGSLRSSLDVVRGEVETMARQHQCIAAQMKSELEEPLAAFSGGMKERRKIVQNGVEKLLKSKIQQTQHVNKTRDRYEQECLKIKGYLAQGHMVMGQEERRNKAKLEKTQISLATSNTEYDGAVKALEETTARWNREWKAAADKFQDLEEERLDFTKSSLWSFANIASTVCVSDDASCEKIRLSLEKMDVEKDISGFIKERGTGQEIPDPPKYINFCRGDVNDSQSDLSEDDNYSVAQFPRSINPAFRTSSPQPSTYESHHDPNSALAHDFSHGATSTPPSREATLTPQIFPAPSDRQRQDAPTHQQQQFRTPHQVSQHGPFASVPHDPYPLDGMTMLCRTGPSSERGSNPTSGRPSSRGSHSDCSIPTSFSSQDLSSGKASPTKQEFTPVSSREKEKLLPKKKSGFFQNHSPFRRKSTKDPQVTVPSRNTWHPRHDPVTQESRSEGSQPYRVECGLSEQRMSPEPIDPNTTLALGVGANVLPVTTTEWTKDTAIANAGGSQVESDPIALALAELKGVAEGKRSSVRVSADHYHGIATPGPGAQSVVGNGAFATGIRGTPPPSYDVPVQRLGVPPQAHTAKAMKEASEKFAGQTRNIFGGSANHVDTAYSRPSTRGHDIPRAASPAPPRNASPRSAAAREVVQPYQTLSPTAQGGAQGTYPRAAATTTHGSDQRHYRQNSPNIAARTSSTSSFTDHGRPTSSHIPAEMTVQLASADDFVQQRGRSSGRPGTSSNSRSVGPCDSTSLTSPGYRQRSKSVAEPSQQYSRDCRSILHLARALYMYQAAIPEELGFAKGDMLAVLRHQDDGWWEAEIHGGDGRIGLVPSNYLQPC